MVIISTAPSWGWFRGRWGFRGGPIISIGGPWWPYEYPYAYDTYDPYNDPYYDPAYAYNERRVNSAPREEPNDVAAVVDNSRYEINTILKQIVRARDYIQFRYQDGDISRDQMGSAGRDLDQIVRDAHSEADAQGGSLTSEQANRLLEQIHRLDPEVRVNAPVQTRKVERSSSIMAAPSRSLENVDDLLLELRALLSQKLKEGSITSAQEEAELRYLEKLEKQAASEADSQNGKLTAEEESAFVQQLHHAYYAINHNLVVN